MSRTIRKLIVHHSAGAPYTTAEEIRRYHTAAPPKGRGWRDIGYHRVIRQLAPGADGWIVEPGRPDEQMGAHDDGQNADSVGVCICGDYTKGPIPLSGLLVLLEELVTLCRRYGLTAADVEGHKENEPATTPTACPGFNPAYLRALVAAGLELSGGGPEATGSRA